jgi:hypothetical protein
VPFRCKVVRMRTRPSRTSATMGHYTAGWTGERGRKTCDSGTCSTCDAKLSVYRPPGESRCAPCLAAAVTQSLPLQVRFPPPLQR